MDKSILPNALSVARIGLCAAFFVLGPGHPAFVPLYLAAGLTDVLDGFFARLLGAQSTLGARLDTAGDICLYGALVALFWPVLRGYTGFAALVGGVVCIRLASAVVHRLRFGRLAFLHTWANKAAGLCVFALPLLYTRVPTAPLFAVCGGVALLSALEELAIGATATTLRLTRRSIFTKW